LGNRYNAGDIARRAKEIKGSSIWKDSQKAGSVLEPLQWLAESSEFARSNVYTPEVLAAVEAAKRSSVEKVEVVDLSESYLKAAGSLSQQRAAFAAHRLAAILSEDLKH